MNRSCENTKKFWEKKVKSITQNDDRRRSPAPPTREPQKERGEWPKQPCIPISPQYNNKGSPADTGADRSPRIRRQVATCLWRPHVVEGYRRAEIGTNGTGWRGGRPLSLTIILPRGQEWYRQTGERR